MKSFKHYLAEERGPFRSPTNSFNDSWINIAPVGVGFFLFRVFGDFADAEVERLPGVFGSKREAQKAAEKVAATTGERIGSK